MIFVQNQHSRPITVRKWKTMASTAIVLCSLLFIGGLILPTHITSDDRSLASRDSAAKSAETGNGSCIQSENGIQKLSVNGKIINDMFGVFVYCTGVDPQTDTFLIEMKEIIDHISRLDIPIMSFDILWSDYDRSISVPKNAHEAADRFHTRNLDALLDYAARKKVSVVLQLLVHAHWELPVWWRDYKDNKDGYQLIEDLSKRSEEYNRLQRPVASYQSETHRELLHALIRKLIVRYKNHPAIIGWGINVGPTGENGYTPNPIEMMDPRTPQVDFRLAMADYSDVAKKNFILWLKKKYGQIERLNESWKSRLASFDQAIPPKPMKITLQETFNFSGDTRTSMKDWQEFRYKAIVDEWRFLSDLVRKYDSSKIIIGKTQWYPTDKQTGSSNMIVSAVDVNQKRLIDVDMTCNGITEKDYLPGIHFSASRIDYADFARFSRSHKTLRIFTLENWIKLPEHRIEIERSVAVKNTIRDEGGYLWFVVAPAQDRRFKPYWSWEEIAALVGRSNRRDLESVAIEDPQVLFYYDIRNVMVNYFEAYDDLRGSKLYRAIGRAFFDADPKLPYGFIRSSELPRSEVLNGVRLLILANQRCIDEETAGKLRNYLLNGGTILLVGSNGVFDVSFQKNSRSLKTLSPTLSDRQIQMLYDWGLRDEIRVPFLVVRRDNTRLIEIPLNGDPAENYRKLKAVLPTTLGLSDHGSLTLETTRHALFHERGMPRGIGAPPESGGLRLLDRPPLVDVDKNFIRDFDANGDGAVSLGEFHGPAEVFRHHDTNRDGVVTREEAAEAARRLPAPAP